MAEDADTKYRIDLDMTAVESTARTLPGVEEDWEMESMPCRMGRESEWRDILDRMDLLEEAYRSGQMTPEQRQRFPALVREFRAVLPIAKRLGFLIPPALASDAA